MKTTLQILLLFFTCGSFAQITLEHTYSEGTVTRVNLEYSGEKYYVLKSATNELMFYNADHSFWKTIVLSAPAPNQFTSTQVFHVSEAKINSDVDIEIVYGYFNDIAKYFESKVISEDGTVLLTIPNASSVYLDEVPGLSDKLITENTGSNTNSKVYSVPDLVLENSYTEGTIKRIKLENSGEKYYVLDKTNQNTKIYNQNHSLWKTIALPKPTNFDFTEIDFISETKINPDKLIEIGYSLSETVDNTTTYLSKIVNEDNVELLTVPKSRKLVINTIDGLADKLFAELPTNFVQYNTNIYNLPSLILEKAYEGAMTRVKLENSGEKYYTSYNPSNNKVQIYNSNHSLWKTIDLTSDSTFLSNNITTVSSISESKINQDALIELVYTYNTGLLAFCCGYSSRIINEKGTILLDAIYILNLQINEINDLANKLTGSQGFTDSNIAAPTLVYSIGNLSTSDFNKRTKVAISPNPAKTFLNINSSASPIKEVTIYNMTGAVVKRETAQNSTKINVEKLPTGIYIVNLTDFNNQKSTHKITVLRQ